ncbi:MAG: glycosyltransferase family 4 protein [Candidatus Moranbacteria bacterium]|nr:glycosyltransferase family 4 protein [Candidatus Moranbacteria bacterium]
MIIGIDASFLRKPGTGIGVVTEQALRFLSRLPEAAHHRFILYLEEYIDPPFVLPGNFEKHVFLPKWTRDDVPRRVLWERKVALKAMEDGCDAFISLSQSATVFQKKSKIRHIMVVHDIVPILFPAYRGKLTNRVHSRAIMGAIGAADRILAVSKITKRDLILNLGIPEDKIAVAYPDCAPRFRLPVEEVKTGRVMERYGLVPGYIYHGGGLEIRKNTGRLLEAYAELRKKRDNAPPLVISGTIHGKRNRLATDVKGIIGRLGISGHVKLLGFVSDEDVPALYREALLFAFPSLYEGFGLPLVEAFAIGTPVLAGRTAGAVPEVAGTAAMLVDTQDVSEIMVGLEKIMDDASFRETLIERGKERVKDFSWETFSGALLSEVVFQTAQFDPERNTETL